MTRSKTILIVEDEEGIREALKLKLKKGGINIMVATSGEEALEILKKRTPNLMVLDIILPHMNGLQLLQLIREDAQLRDLPVVVMSVSGGEEKIKQAFALNIIDYLIKSEYTIDQIVKKLQEIITNELPEKKKKIPPPGFSLLVIEDDIPTCEAITMKLKKKGFLVEFAEDGEAGFQKLFQKTFSGVLLDLRLPRVDGFEFLERKSQDEKLKKIPVMIFSNFGQPEYIHRSLALGARGYVVKTQHSIDEIVDDIAKCFLEQRCYVEFGK